MLHKIDNMVPTHVWVLQRIKADGMHSEIKNGRSKFGTFALFILDGTRPTRNCQISLFQKITAAEIHSELALCFDDDACTLASVHHWIHEFKIG
jgi:hypothetical protein